MALALFPRAFDPWPGALAAFFLAALAAVVPAWLARGRPLVYPLVALVLLPLYRVVLLLLRHGAPPWPIRGWGWLTAADFPWWAGASLLAASYAGTLARIYMGIRPRALFLRRLSVLDPGYYGNLDARVHEEDRAALGFAAVARSILVPALIGAGVFAAMGPGVDRYPVMFCAMLFLALGSYFLGLTNARRMRAGWAEQGVAAPGVEGRWWEGYGRLLLLILAVLPFLPGGFRPIRLERLLSLIPDRGFQEAAEEMTRRMAAQPPPPPQPAPPAAAAGGNSLLESILHALFFLLRIGALLALGAVALMLLGGVGRVLWRWLRSLAPLWEGVRRFFRALRVLCGEAAERLPAGLRRRRKHRASPAVISSPPRTWPPTPLRELFARLVLWGREHGLPLGRAQTPQEIGRDLARLVPDRQDDLNLIVEGYRRERYGGVGPDRGELARCREAWTRLAGREAPANGPAENGGKRHE